MTLIPAEELLPRRRSTLQMRAIGVAYRQRVANAAGVDPEFDDCYGDLLAKIAVCRRIEPLPIYRDNSGDSRPPFYLGHGIERTAPFTSARQRYRHEAERQQRDRQNQARMAELRRYYEERNRREREARNQPLMRELFQQEIERAPRNFVVVGGEQEWRDKAVAWLKRYPPGHHRLTALRAAQAQTHTAARCLWDELAVELGLVAA